MPPPLFSLSLLTSLSSLLRSAVASLGAVHEKDEDELELELELVALKSILAKYRHEKQIGQVGLIELSPAARDARRRDSHNLVFVFIFFFVSHSTRDNPGWIHVISQKCLVFWLLMN